eukprot:gb/GEZN01007895.1/.p2 GENE.gb/GEZN01007895.1/~~gb/GEZN01007895.1/.p2  ORF type:complete len:187 (+),score=30.90 gb/GEZN01007895.1/:22-561(+)
MPDVLEELRALDSASRSDRWRAQYSRLQAKFEQWKQEEAVKREKWEKEEAVREAKRQEEHAEHEKVLNEERERHRAFRAERERVGGSATPCIYFFSKTGDRCRNGSNCKFAHQLLEVLPGAKLLLPGDFSKPSCHFFWRGLCDHGDACLFSHGSTFEQQFYSPAGFVLSGSPPPRPEQL